MWRLNLGKIVGKCILAELMDLLIQMNPVDNNDKLKIVNLLSSYLDHLFTD